MVREGRVQGEEGLLLLLLWGWCPMWVALPLLLLLLCPLWEAGGCSLWEAYNEVLHEAEGDQQEGEGGWLLLLLL